MTRSQQGFNIAFVGINYRAQTACAQYLKNKRKFKYISMDDPLRRFLRAGGFHPRLKRFPLAERLEYYDAVHKINPNFFIDSVKFRMGLSKIDTVIWDVRYINELKQLKDMGFIICRVTSGKSPIHLKKYVGKAESGTVAVAMTYDSNLAFQSNVDYSVEWSGPAVTKVVMDSFLERIGYKLDL